jgi:hypothetical protein
MIWYFNESTGNFAIDAIPTQEVEIDGKKEVVTEDGWKLIASRPEPFDDYVFDGENWVLKTVESAIVPQSITPRQARLKLLEVGLLDELEAVITTNRSWQIEWEYATEVKRDSLLIDAIATQAGLTSEQIDQMFIEASTL